MQVHDSIVVETKLPSDVDPSWVPRKGEPLPPSVEALRKRLEECMTVRIPGWPYALTAEADVGKSYAEV